MQPTAAAAIASWPTALFSWGPLVHFNLAITEEAPVVLVNPAMYSINNHQVVISAHNQIHQLAVNTLSFKPWHSPPLYSVVAKQRQKKMKHSKLFEAK